MECAVKASFGSTCGVQRVEFVTEDATSFRQSRGRAIASARAASQRDDGTRSLSLLIALASSPIDNDDNDREPRTPALRHRSTAQSIRAARRSNDVVSLNSLDCSSRRAAPVAREAHTRPRMSTKETLRLLSQLFSSSSTSTKSTNPFSHFDLPDQVYALLDNHLRTFASSFPLTSATGSSGQSEGERERARWREGLLEIWALVEPLPGTEREQLAKVSAFLLLLHRLSADAGDDDDSALISRKDVGSVWWGAVLRRTMLGTAKDGDQQHLSNEKSRGRKPNRKGKEAAADPASTGSSMRPLYVSRQALNVATKTVVWGMAARKEDVDKGDDFVSPFGLVILHEYEDRALARLKGLDEGYGVNNLEECVISWGEQSPKVRSGGSTSVWMLH